MINGITFSEQLITSADFAHFMYTFLNKENGVTKGCGISHADGKIYVQKGYFMEFGRMVQVIGVEEIDTPEVLSGHLYCKVVFEIDLSKTNTVDEFNQGYFKTLTSTTGYPEETKEDLDNGGILYQMPWCQYIKKADTISEFRDLRDILDMESIWSAVSMQNGQYKGEFDEYFAEQKTVIKRMIADLEGEGYLLLEDARRVREITLPASGWSNTAPYKQTVAVPGLKETDRVQVASAIKKDTPISEADTWEKMANMVKAAEALDGKAEFYCTKKKPTADFKIALVGGSGDE